MRRMEWKLKGESFGRGKWLYSKLAGLCFLFSVLPCGKMGKIAFQLFEVEISSTTTESHNAIPAEVLMEEGDFSL